MVAQSPRRVEREAWQQALHEAYTRPQALLSDLGLTAADVGLCEAAAREFPLRVPRPFAARMARGDPHDPLLRQVLPHGAELRPVPGYAADPVGDRAAQRAPGLLQKYAGRALLVLSGGCAVNCRYCFRRAYPYAEAVGRGHLEQALATLAADASIAEIILSGGDPLLWDDAALHTLVRRLAGLPQLTRLRVHTRLPVVIPARATDGLAAALTGTRLQPVVVLHTNHPQEIDAALAAACGRLRAAGLTLLNQSVLLAGVNDDAAVLSELSQRLFAAGVLPYYLHVLDRVAGAAHFDLPRERAAALGAELRERLPGYLVPRVVEERAGASAKLPIA